MLLLRHQPYQIMLLSQHRLGPKFGHKSVPKLVKCSISTVHNRWKQSTCFNDLTRTSRAYATTSKQNQQIVSLDEQQTFVTSRDITSKGQRENGATTGQQNTMRPCRRHYSLNTIE